MDEKQEYCSCSAKHLVDLYERLREYALNTLGSPLQVYGLGVLMLRGMPAWIKAAADYTNIHYHRDNNDMRNNNLQSNQLHEILAEMVIQYCHTQEVSR